MLSHALVILFGVLAFVLPDRSRPGIFFGVAVDPNVPSTLESRRILFRYR